MIPDWPSRRLTLSETEKPGHLGGRLIAAYRNRRGIGQQDLAQLSHCSRSMIAQIELGTRLPSSELLGAVSEALGLNVIEQAVLFHLYGKVQEDAMSMLPYAIAVLCLDADLRADQSESLIRLLVQQYKEAVEANQRQIVASL
jgi:transcriptional regulator with XRE-family HTH domain